MNDTVKGSPQLMKGLNTSIILELVKTEGPISRIDIARATNLSNPAVSVIIADLLAKGLVEEIGTAPSTGGRPARLVKFNSEAGFLLGLDVGATKIAGAIVDLSGHIVTRKYIETHGPEGSLTRLTALIAEMINQFGTVDQFWGIGLGIPGVTDPQGHQVCFAPGLGWEDVNLGKHLHSRFGLPVWVDNDVNVTVRGERWCGALKGVNNGLCMTIGTGIGVGLLINGQVYQGQRGAAGEVGYWLLDNKPPLQRVQGYGHLESFAAGPGIAKRAQELMRSNGKSLLFDLVGGQINRVTAKEVFQAAEQGDSLGKRIVEDTTDTIGIAISNLACLLDFEKMVISGGVSRAGEILLHPIRDIVAKLVPFPPEIVLSDLQEDAGMLGGVAGVLELRRSSFSFSEVG